MPRIRYVAGAVTLAMGSVSFGLFAATASAQAPGSTPTAVGTAIAGAGHAAATGAGTSGAAGAPTALRTPAGDPAAGAPGGGGGGVLSNNTVQVVVGNHNAPCSPVVGQQVTGANTAQVAVTNDSGNGIGNIGNGNGRGTGGTENHNITAINQNVSVS